MLKTFAIAFIVIAIIHGLIHLLGFLAYWPLAKIPDLPYQTALLNGRLDLDAAGMRIYSLAWLLAALGFVAAAILLATGRSVWAPLMLGATLLSLVICILNWSVTFRGAIIDLIIMLVLFIVFGLRVEPAPFSTYSAPSSPVETIPLPPGLPEPVERFYRQAFGDEIPVYTSAVISGRGTARFMGITFPARLRFTHDAGNGYHHYIETTFFGLPIMKVNEYYLDGHTRLELPFGVVENDPGVDSAANQGLWGEKSAYPSAFLTDSGVRWEAVDPATARLYAPYGEKEQVFAVYFDPQSGAMMRMETQRYRDAKVGTLRWWGDIVQGESQAGGPASTTFMVTWEDEGTPWLKAKIEELVFNTDVKAYIRQSGL